MTERLAINVLAGVALALLGCGEPEWKREIRAKWHGPCNDEARLLATTAGSPDSFECPNKRHRMRVQVASTGSPEEAAALVFCECTR